MAKMGRPPKPFDKASFEKLCELSCTKEEVAAFFSMSEDTVERKVYAEYEETFAVVYKRFQGIGNQSLRRMQLQAAQKGNVTMLIWLGKQRLGQADKNELTGKDGQPLEFTEIKRIIVDPKS